MEWKVEVPKSVKKQVDKLPPAIKEAYDLLVVDLQANGPEVPSWYRRANSGPEKQTGNVSLPPEQGEEPLCCRVARSGLHHHNHGDALCRNT